MGKRYTLLNIVLLIIAIILGERIYNIWNNYIKKPSSIVIKASKIINNEDTREYIKRSNPQIFYQTIVDKNLFHPNRREIKTEEEFNSQIAPPKFILSGVVLMGDTKIAIIEDPISHKTNRYHEKDSILNYTIDSITNDKVFIKKGDNKFEVNLLDSSKKRHMISPNAGIPSPIQTPAIQPPIPPIPISPFRERQESPGKREREERQKMREKQRYPQPYNPQQPQIMPPPMGNIPPDNYMNSPDINLPEEENY